MVPCNETCQHANLPPSKRACQPFARRKIRHCALSMRPFHNVDDIAGKGWSRSGRLLLTSRRDTLNFHVRLHARSVTATCRWFCTPLVYQIESIGLVWRAWRVLAILEIHVRRVIAFHYPVEVYIPRRHRRCSRKISILHFSDPCLATIFGRRIDRRKERNAGFAP